MNFGELFRDSFRTPVLSFRKVLAMSLPEQALWLLLLLAVVLTGIQTAMVLQVDGGELPPGMEFLRKPILATLLQFAFLALFVVVLDGLLRWANGKNRRVDILLAMAWVQALQTVLGLVQILVFLVAPALSDLFGLGVLVFVTALLTIFVSEASGNDNPGKSFLLILAALFVAAMAMGIFLLATGIVRAEDLAQPPPQTKGLSDV